MCLFQESTIPVKILIRFNKWKFLQMSSSSMMSSSSSSSMSSSSTMMGSSDMSKMMGGGGMGGMPSLLDKMGGGVDFEELSTAGM